MNDVVEHLRRLAHPNVGWLAVIAAIALTCLGVIAIGGSSNPEFAMRQLQNLVVAVIVMVIVMTPHPKTIGHLAYPFMGVTVVLLVVLLIPGIPNWLVPVRNNAPRWINLHFMLMQPSELAKIAFVLAAARYFRYRESHRNFTGLLWPFAFMFVPVVLILKEPDLGGSLGFAPALLFILVAAGARLSHLFSLLGVGILVVGVNVAMIYTLPDDMQILKGYQRARITQFIDREGDQQRIAMTVLGAGGVEGYGERSPIIVRANLLPEDHNDMIFAVIVNRWGLTGGALVIGLYAAIVLSFMMVAARLKDPFARLTTVGFAGLIFFQAFINIGMTLGMLPITGLTLPFVSYGGTSLLVSFMMVGLVINFASRRPAYLARPSFEFDNADAIFQ